MRLLAFVLIACVALRLLQLALAVGLVALALFALWAIIKRPAEVLGLFALGLLYALLQSHPIVATATVIALWAGARSTRTMPDQH